MWEVCRTQLAVAITPQSDIRYKCLALSGTFASHLWYTGAAIFTTNRLYIMHMVYISLYRHEITTGRVLSPSSACSPTLQIIHDRHSPATSYNPLQLLIAIIDLLMFCIRWYQCKVPFIQLLSLLPSFGDYHSFPTHTIDHSVLSPVMMDCGGGMRSSEHDRGADRITSVNDRPFSYHSFCLPGGCVKLRSFGYFDWGCHCVGSSNRRMNQRSGEKGGERSLDAIKHKLSCGLHATNMLSRSLKNLRVILRAT